MALEGIEMKILDICRKIAENSHKNVMNPKCNENTWVQPQPSLEWMHRPFLNKTSLNLNDLVK